MHVINSIGSEIDESSVRIILENLTYDNFLTEQQAKIILSAVTDNVLRELAPPGRNRLRASIFKSMLLNSL
jgi:transcriptional regulator CtsR